MKIMSWPVGAACRLYTSRHGTMRKCGTGIVCCTPARCVQWPREATYFKFHNCTIIIAAARPPLDTTEGAPDYFFRGTVISVFIYCCGSSQAVAMMTQEKLCYLPPCTSAG